MLIVTSFSETLKYLQTKSDLHLASVVLYSWGAEHLREATEKCQKHTSEARFIAGLDDRYADGYVAEQKAASTRVGAGLLQLTCLHHSIQLLGNLYPWYVCRAGERHQPRLEDEELWLILPNAYSKDFMSFWDFWGKMTCLNNTLVCSRQGLRCTEALSSPPDRSSPSHPSSSTRNVLASLCQQADLKAGRAFTQGTRHSVEKR